MAYRWFWSDGAVTAELHPDDLAVWTRAAICAEFPAYTLETAGAAPAALVLRALKLRQLRAQALADKRP